MALASSADVSDLPDSAHIEDAEQQILAQTLARQFSPTTNERAIVKGFDPAGKDEHGPLFRQVERTCGLDVAACLPFNLDTSKTFRSPAMPQAVNMGVFALADALGDAGITAEELRQSVSPSDIGIYGATSYGSLDDLTHKSLFVDPLMGARLRGRLPSFLLPDMPGATMAAYVLGTVCRLSCVNGACAAFVSALRSAVLDIQSGATRVAIIWSADRAAFPELIDAFAAGKAAPSPEQVLAMQHRHGEDSSAVNHSRVCRPFADNCGTILGDGSQVVIVMSDDLAKELGTNVDGAVLNSEMFSDGFKGSFAAPGAGNLYSLGRSMAAARELLGQKHLDNSVMYAHGSGTPKNRTTESELFGTIADTFHIKQLKVTALKGLLGHTLGTASGDQFVTALSTFRHGVLPGIQTAKEAASDARHDRLSYAFDSEEVGDVPLAFINARGLGGNNATACLSSPSVTCEMLTKRYGRQAMKEWQVRAEQRSSAREAHDARIHAGQSPVTQYDSSGKRMLEIGAEGLDIDTSSIRGQGLADEFLNGEWPYRDLSLES